MLLDTNSLLWVLTDNESLGSLARRELAAVDEVCSSAISVVELRIKAMLGRLEVPDDVVERMRDAGIVELPYLHEHADRLFDFPELVRHDPFDRMLIAHASATGHVLLTSDEVLLTSAPQLTRDARL